VYSPIIAGQQLGKNPPIIARQQLGKNPVIIARQWLSRNVTVVTNTHATIEELLDASFSMWPMSYQGKYAISSSQNFLVSPVSDEHKNLINSCSVALNLHSSMEVADLTVQHLHFPVEMA
jgi:hypothetical protein